MFSGGDSTILLGILKKYFPREVFGENHQALAVQQGHEGKFVKLHHWDVAVKAPKKEGSVALFFKVISNTDETPALFIPVTTITPGSYDPSQNCIQLPDLMNSNLKMCLMITPVLRSSTFYIRGSFDPFKPPAVCQMRLGAGNTGHDDFSQALDHYATNTDPQFIPKSQVWWEHQGFTAQVCRTLHLKAAAASPPPPAPPPRFSSGCRPCLFGLLPLLTGIGGELGFMIRVGMCGWRDWGGAYPWRTEAELLRTHA